MPTKRPCQAFLQFLRSPRTIGPENLGLNNQWLSRSTGTRCCRSSARLVSPPMHSGLFVQPSACIQQGSFASVYLVQSASGRVYAMKRLKLFCPDAKGSLKEDDFAREASMMHALLHPHIIRFHDGFVANGRPHFVMEWATGGDLRAFLCAQSAPVAEVKVNAWLHQLACALVGACVAWPAGMQLINDVATPRITCNRGESFIEISNPKTFS
jgi:hypothetical protein